MNNVVLVQVVYTRNDLREVVQSIRLRYAVAVVQQRLHVAVWTVFCD